MRVGTAEVSVEREFRLYPLSDVHFPNHNEKAFAKWLKIVAADKKALVILGGDMFDHMRTKAQKYIQAFEDNHSINDPVTEMDKMWVGQLAQKLLPIREKIIGCVGGNHGWQRSDGTVSDQNLMKALVIEKYWLGATGVIDIYVRPTTKKAFVQVRTLLHHTGPGRGGSTRGGDYNVFAKGSQRFDCDIICLGHTHDIWASHAKETQIGRDFSVKTPVYIRSGSFQRGFEGKRIDEPMAPHSPTYVENSMFSAPTFGIPYCHVRFEDGVLLKDVGVRQVAS